MNALVPARLKLPESALTEAGIGVCYSALAYALLRLFEVDGRRRASFETM